MRVGNTLILINPEAKGETALERWDLIEHHVLQQLTSTPLEYNTKAVLHGDDHSMLDNIIAEHSVDTIIAAGGDGTVNMLLNYLMKTGQNDRIRLGAIGLGSSNDFHKPFKTVLNGIPIRINQNDTSRVDVGNVKFKDYHGVEVEQYFIINASLGLTAESNMYFNSGERTLNTLKRTHTGSAILYAAFRTLLHHRRIPARVRTNGTAEKVWLNNLAALKSPYVSGSFSYDADVKPDDGLLGVCLCSEMNRVDLVRVMYDLSHGHFPARKGRSSRTTNSLEVDTEIPVALETDGEVFMGHHFSFSVLPRSITLLGK
jgi:diacylglycerol kinase (ATP)